MLFGLSLQLQRLGRHQQGLRDVLDAGGAVEHLERFEFQFLRSTQFFLLQLRQYRP